MKDKRKAQRVACLVPVEGKEGGPFDLTKTTDISKSGIGFVSDKKIPLNKEITIELDLDQKQEPVFVVGKVQWVHPIAQSQRYRIGLSFFDILHGAKSRLEKYFNK
ncbi:MAG TPA: PilZ domain-containing protein [Candidatus Omnitrophota bacterium]|nr:PilZ domain-containing protein [Candidatus Omnitrophota bacterium]